MCDEQFLRAHVERLTHGTITARVRMNEHLRVTGNNYILERFVDTLLLHQDSFPGERTEQQFALARPKIVAAT